jgi:UDP-glucose 4-epimerase
VIRTLVVGGGFLGAHVATASAAAGDQVMVYSRSFNEWLLADDRYRTGTIELLEGTVPPGRGLQDLIAEADIVYYLAGSGTPANAKDDPGGSIIGSVVPAAAVLDLMRDTPTRRIVVASSGGTVYGQPGHLPTDERQPTEPISIHGHNSLSVERYAMFFARQYGLEPVILRYSNPYGPGQLARRGQGVIAAWCNALARDEPVVVYGSMENRRDFIHVQDAADATLLAAKEAPRPGIYNVGSGRSYALAEILDLIQRAAGRQGTVQRMAARGVDVPITQLDCSRLLECTGWSARVSLEEGVKQSWAWAAELACNRHD